MNYSKHKQQYDAKKEHNNIKEYKHLHEIMKLPSFIMPFYRLILLLISISAIICGYSIKCPHSLGNSARLIYIVTQPFISFVKNI